MNHAQFWGGAAAAPYEIEQSLRFDGSSKLSRTNGSGGNLRTFTQSFWVKREGTTTDVIFEARGDTNNWSTTTFSTGLLSQNRVSGTTYGINTADSGINYRDPAAWYHVVVSYSNAVPTLYVNGSVVSTSNNNSSDWHFLRNGYTLSIGARGNNAEYLNGYLAEIHFVDGTALNQYDFGEFDDNGVWRPIEVSGLTYGTNGFYLKFDPSATNGIGHDHSGNGNNFTPSGFTTSGTGTDVMSDTPTNNWCTLNSLDFLNVNYKPTFSEGNLRSSGTSARAYGTIAIPSSGKYYFEGQAAVVGTSTAQFGIDAARWGSNGYMYYLNTSGTYTQVYLGTYGNQTLGIFVDVDNNEVTFYKNNTSVGTTSVSTMAGTLPFFNHGGNWSWRLNFGQRAFTYTPPTGCLTLNTANLPAPDIAKGSDYFNTVLWTGTSVEHAITGVGFQPDFTWIKGRDNNTNHVLADAVRGATKVLESDSNASEYTDAQSVKSFDTDGVTLGNSNDVNNSTAGYNQYVGWNWLAANGTETNEAGSINSTVSANPTAGFSIVSYTGNATSGATVGHNLGVAPSMTILKSRDSATNWYVWHAGLTQPDYQIYLNLTNAQDTSVLTFLNDKAPTSTVFELPGSGYGSNNSGVDYIAYCFAEVEGYSKFGSYTGNGSADGPFIYTGFAPAMVIMKSSSNSHSWIVMDRARNTYNLADKVLLPDSSVSENTNYYFIDFLSNGFKVRDAGGQNISGWTNIWAAFAENPFGGSGVSPATAR